MSSRDKPAPRWLGGALVVGAFAALLWAENRRPLRDENESKMRRNFRNLAVAGLSAATLQVVEKPVVRPLAAVAQRRRWGLLPWLGLPRWLEIPVAVLLLDYTLYHWHVLTHKAPFLWRFHAVHHVDLDLDTSTAIRFHFGEMALSVPWRVAQVLTIGAPPRALAVWQTLLLISVMFHHSNLRLPPAIERRLARCFVTPRMHGIHHSVVPEETNSNWSSGLTIWDRLHGTLNLGPPQKDVTIGIPAYREPDEVRLPRLVRMPFEQQRPSFRYAGGETPRRLPSGKGELD